MICPDTSISSRIPDDNRPSTIEAPSLKEFVNGLIWAFGPGRLTLEEADNLACHITTEIELGGTVPDALSEVKP